MNFVASLIRGHMYIKHLFQPMVVPVDASNCNVGMFSFSFDSTHCGIVSADLYRTSPFDGMECSPHQFLCHSGFRFSLCLC